MAAFSRHLPRGLAQARCATLRSSSNLERNSSCFSIVDESPYANLESKRKARRDEVLEPNNIPASSETNPPAQCSRVFGVRYYNSSSTTALERCLVSFRSTSELHKLGPHGDNLRHISPRATYYIQPSALNFRSVSTAVSVEDKQRPEVDDEDLDLKTDDDNLENANTSRNWNDVVAENDADTSMYASTEVSSRLATAGVNKFLKISPEDRERYFGEGFPSGLLKEFDDTKETAFLVRARVLHLCERFEKCLAETVKSKELQEQGSNVRFFASKPRQCLLEGFLKGGKSAALAMLVHWARMQGWLVFYVPNGREWTSVGMYFRNAETGLFDTPIQAKTSLEGFLKSHGKILGELNCRILKPIHLGEGAGMGKVRGPQQVTLPEGATLRDLVERGVAQSQAAVSCVVRLREELDLVQEVPVLIAIDEFNSWFTFSSYHESTGTRSRRPIHANELSMVNAFRSMEGPLMMATAFSQSLAVGKLPVHLPGVPKGVRFSMLRYSLEETRAALNYYYSRKITQKEPTEEDIKKLFYLTNGNGEELRNLVRLL